MPVLSPVSRYSTTSSSSLSSGSYRSTLSSSTSLDRPYFSSTTGSYVAPRSSTVRSSYATRTNYVTGGVGEYRTSHHRLTFDSDGVRERKTSTYTSEYSRRTRAPSISDSDSGISGVYGASRSDRSGSRSRDTSVTRSESSRTTAASTRNDAPGRPYMSATTAELFEKYSPSKYVPLSQRLSTAATGETGRTRNSAAVASVTVADTNRPPRRLRPQDTEVKLPRTHHHQHHHHHHHHPSSAPFTVTTNSEKRHAANNASNVAKPCAVVPPECATSINPKLTATDSANNADSSRVKRDVECTQRQKDPVGLSKSRVTSSTSTYIPRARATLSQSSSSWSDRKTSVPSLNGYRGTAVDHLSDDNGNDLQLSVSDIRRKFDPKMTVTKLPSRDPELVARPDPDRLRHDLLYKTAHSSDNIYGAVRNLNGGSSSSLADEKPVPVHKPISSAEKYLNGTTGSLKWDFPSGRDAKDRESPAGDVSTIYVAGKVRPDTNSIKNQLNANNPIGKILEKSTTICAGNGDAKNSNDDTAKRDKSHPGKLVIEIGGKGQPAVNGCSEEAPDRTEHTADFASYVQVDSSPTPSASNRVRVVLHNGDLSDGGSSSSPDETNSSTPTNEPPPPPPPPLPPPSTSSSSSTVKSSVRLLSPNDTALKYIDSEPGLDYNGKDDDDDDSNYEEGGFENKTFEHANGHLLRKGADEVDFKQHHRLTNGTVKSIDDLSDDDDVVKAKSPYSSGSPSPSTKRKSYLNGDASSPSSLYQIYQNESLTNAKNTSPVNTLASASSSALNNSNGSPCGSLTTSRRRSVDSKSPQPGSEQIVSKKSGLNGLRNIGNTCFMNSVVQCLSNTKPLLEYCGSPDQFTPHINTTLSCMKGALIKAFSTVITELWKPDETDGVVNTTSLKSQIQRFAPRFMGYSQQDAQEFLRYLLEGLHEDVNRVTVKPKPILTEIDENLSDAQKAEESWQRYLRSEDSKVGDIFVGQLKSSLRCTHCSHTSVTFDPFWDLSLPIPSRTGQLKLSQCLSHFTREEEMDGDEKPTCSKCQVRRKCLKWFTVQKFPRVLVLHLKRFSPTERFRGKLNVPVEFPLTGLDMTPFAATTTRGPPPPPAIYNLYAVSNHSGTTYSGHYTAYCKHPYNGEWHEYNDSRVSSISPKNVVSSEAYVLFYELANGNSLTS